MAYYSKSKQFLIQFEKKYSSKIESDGCLQRPIPDKRFIQLFIC